MENFSRWVIRKHFLLRKFSILISYMFSYESLLWQVIIVQFIIVITAVSMDLTYDNNLGANLR